MRRLVPRYVHFPGGYEVTVRRFSEEDANSDMGPDTYAQWDVEDREIHLRTDRRPKAMREDFVHEMEHAFIDWKDWFLGKSEGGR